MVERLRRAGIPVTDRQVPTREVYWKIAKHTSVRPRTVQDIRYGLTSGERTASRVEASRVLKSNDASSKDRAYLSVLTEAYKLRKKGASLNRYTVVGFVTTLADRLNVDEFDILRAARAMRAEIVLDQDILNPLVTDEFLTHAHRYIYDYTHGSHPSAAVTKLGKEWDGVTIGDFYRKFYAEVDRVNSRATWFPYEVEALQSFYEQRIREMSTLSRYDILVLRNRRNRVSKEAEVVDVRQLTGIPYSSKDSNIHIRALVCGKLAA